MSERRFILAPDQGTTSSRAILFDRTGTPVATAQREHAQHHPRPGWGEHDPGEVWQSQPAVAQVALRQAGAKAAAVAAIGITNQRETTVLWERATGQPVAPAIVWQDRRTAAECEKLTARGAAYLAGLPVDFWSGLDESSRQRRAARRFEPAISATERHDRLSRWHRAVERARSWEQPAAPPRQS